MNKLKIYISKARQNSRPNINRIKRYKRSSPLHDRNARKAIFVTLSEHYEHYYKELFTPVINE